MFNAPLKKLVMVLGLLVPFFAYSLCDNYQKLLVNISNQTQSLVVFTGEMQNLKSNSYKRGIPIQPFKKSIFDIQNTKEAQKGSIVLELQTKGMVNIKSGGFKTTIQIEVTDCEIKSVSAMPGDFDYNNKKVNVTARFKENNINVNIK